MGSSMHEILPQWQYAGFIGETTEWVKKVFTKSLNSGELTKLEGMKRRPSLPTHESQFPAFMNEVDERKTMAHKLMCNMIDDKASGKLQMKKAGVTSALGYNFYDLRAPVFLEYPVNVPFRNSMPRVGRVNDGVGVAANWKATRNPGTPYAGASEGNRVGQGTPDEHDYTAKYKELGVERAATFTSEYAGEGLTSNLADDHLRGLHSLFLQEEGMDLLGNGGVSSGSNGFAFGTAPTPTTTVVATHTTPGAAGSTVTSDLPYTTINTTSTFISVYVVLLTGMGNPANQQYGYGVFPTIAGGLTPSYQRTNADGSKDTIAGGTSAISLTSTPLQCTSGNLTVKAVIPAASLPVKGCFGYAWYVDSETSSTSSLAGAKLAGITTTPFAFITGTPTGTQTGAATNLNVDNSFNTLDYDGLLTYCASTAGATWTDLQGATLTSSKNGRVAEVETILQSIFNAYQAGIDEIWGSADAITNLDAAIRYNGTTASGFQFIYSRDSQNNLLGGFVVSSYQSRYAVASPSGANVIPIRIHPMIPPGTLFFHVKTNPYPHSRVKNVIEMLVQRDYYAIEWPLVSRQWTFGTYAHQVIRHNYPWIPAVLTGIGPFVGT